MLTEHKYRSRGLAVPSRRGEERSVMMYGLLILFAGLYLLAAPFQRGLFLAARVEGDPRVNLSYELPIQSTLLLISFVMLAMAVYVWKYRDQLGKHTAAVILVWLLPVSALCSYFQAVSLHYGFLLIQAQVLYAAMFLLGLLITLHPAGRKLLPQFVAFSSYAVVVYGLLNLFGNVHYNGAVMVESYGLRLSSVFQYPNANAGFLLLVIACAAYGAVTARNQWVSLLHAVMLVPALLSLMLTLSRGALLMLPLILWLLLFLLPVSRQLLLLLHAGAAAIGMLCLLTSVTETALTVQQHAAPAPLWPSWGLLLGASLAAALVSVGLQHVVLLRLPKLRPGGDAVVAGGEQEHKPAPLWSRRWTLPAALALLGAAAVFLAASDSPLLNLLPRTLEQRIRSIDFQQHSVLERGVFYMDSLKIIRDYPVFGAGGGAWSALYPTYQSYPYTSRQAHNFILQLWVEQGTAGVLAFLALFLYTAIRYIRAVSRLGVWQEPHLFYAITAGALLLHSAIDFDLSFVYLASVVFLCLGGMAAIGGERLGESSATDKRVRRWSVGNAKPAAAYSVLLAAAAIFVLITGASYVSGGRTMQSAVNSLSGQSEIDVKETAGLMQEALRKQPDNPGYMLLLMNLLELGYEQTKDERFDQEAGNWMAQLQRVEPLSKELLEARWNRAVRQQDLDQALTIADEALGRFPWDQTMYERAMGLRFQLSEKERLEHHDQAAAKRHRTLGTELFRQFLLKRKQLDDMPKTINLGKSFEVTPAMAISTGQMLYIEGQYTEAAAALKLGMDGRLEEPIQQAIARWYLAALARAGKADQELLGKLIEQNKEEQNLLEQLIHAQF
ncbi:O-antigen ligase family protein [Paenibacillus doosanensis]|uniref:O-antigen ligase family protein n=1 Tax=Paenibacillus doosanensis TaxID=1229154 RepID=UPI002180736C|nr:O-antigen ligase family protein [Paenibacillus doosanensis]MCS7462098.1 O-antigen ligase family protein [Paenibacillus doosanensis]